MKNVYRLKAESEDALNEVLLSVLKTYTNTSGELSIITSTHDYFIDICGVLYAETGVTLTDEDGNEYPEKAAIEGYHANLVTKDADIIEALSDYIIEVDTPLVKIAGEA